MAEDFFLVKLSQDFNRRLRGVNLRKKYLTKKPPNDELSQTLRTFKGPLRLSLVHTADGKSITRSLFKTDDHKWAAWATAGCAIWIAKEGHAGMQVIVSDADRAVSVSFADDVIGLKPVMMRQRGKACTYHIEGASITS
jgi:hypothetical protein